MAISAERNHIRFGKFLLDTKAGELRKSGIRVRVPDQSIKVLCLLLRRPGDVITREEICYRLWPNGTVVEFEHSVNNAVRRLRAALEDSAEKPRFVETLPKRGYRFIFPCEAPSHPVEEETDGTETEDPEDLSGRQFGPYQVLQKLGEGATAVVYRGFDPRLIRFVALKFLAGHLLDSPPLRRRFEDEARLASTLNHPNVCTIYDVGKDDGRPYITMELLEGATLEQLLQRGALPLSLALYYAKQIAAALEAAHRSGIVHRDVKPGNIFITNGCLVKVTDFGVAQRRTPVPGSIPNSSGVLAVGTPGYIAPEQLQGNAADAQGDIFGFGVAFHEMLVGRKPVDREQSRPNVVTAIRSAAPVHSRFSKEFERILERILRGCLQNDPRERYRSAEELVGDLGLAIVKFKIESRPRHDFWPGRKVLRRESAERVRFDGVPEEKVASDHEAELAAWSQMLEIPVQGASEQRQKVESAGDSNPYPTAPPNETASRRLSPARRLAGFAPIGTWALIALAGILSGVYAIHSAKQIPGHKPRSLNVEPLTSYPGNEIQPSLSPSGNQVAFAFRDDRSSNYHICVKPTDAEEPTCLTSASADDLSPSWSPDGKRIVFLRFVSNQIAFLTVIPSVGGREREVAKILVDRSLREIRAAWSPDGEWIATSEAQTPVSPMRLVLISANTGERRRLVYQPPTVRGDLSPSFSPDGRYLVFARHISPAVADIYILGLPKSGQSSSEARRLTNWNRLTRNPLWAGNGREIFFVGEQPGLGPRIWRVPAFQAESARLLDHFGEDSSSIALCPRGNRLVYAKQAEEASIWRIDLSKAGQERAFRGSARLSRLIASTRGAVNPQYSPDGKYIAFQSERSGYTEIWLANSDGSASRQLTQLKAAISGYPRWSPDGKHIIFHSRPSGYANISVLDVETREYRELTTGTTNDSAPSWSHDRKWIYFGSTRQDGSQIWKMPASGGPATRLTKSGGAVALESGDGKLLFFSKHYAAGLWVLPVEGGTESQILPSLYGIDTFAVTKRGIYFVDRTLGGEASLNFISLLSRATQKIVSMKSQVGMGLTVSPDEKSVLYSQIDYAGSDLILVDNFK